MRANQYSTIETPASESTLTSRSPRVRGRTAAQIPSGRAMSTERAMVTPVRRNVAGSRSRAIGRVSRDSGIPPWARGLLIP